MPAEKKGPPGRLAFRNRGHRVDDHGSMPLALLITIVATGLSAVLSPLVVSQIQATHRNAMRVQALSAAQAGIDVALAAIRSAGDGAGAGVAADLPCGPLTGSIDTSGTQSYKVDLHYLNRDPKGSWTPTDPVLCTPGYGTGANVPMYALLISEGSGPPGGARRTLRATYTFHTTDGPVAGGLIHAFQLNPQDPSLCLDAGSAEPANPTYLLMRSCVPGKPSQLFAYNRDLTISLPSAGMCVTAKKPYRAGDRVTLEPCTAALEQQWVYNGSANFEGTDGTNRNGYCLNVGSGSDRYVVLGWDDLNTCRGPYDNVQAFSPDAAVGAGAAGARTDQLVNYQQFGRCLDVTNGHPEYDFLISWTCKQAPNANIEVPWNQHWTLPAGATAPRAVGRITTRKPTGSHAGFYCLESPGVTGRHAKVELCPEGSGDSTINRRWTVYRQAADPAIAYTIRDFRGDCLAPIDPEVNPQDTYDNGAVEVSKIVVARCDGSNWQKWNAPPKLTGSPLKDFNER